MLVLLPVALAFVGAFAILILQRVRPSYGDTWLVALGVSLVVWGLVLALHWQENVAVSLGMWWPVDRTVYLTFQADRISWMYAFSLASLGMAVALTAAVRLRFEISSLVWTETLLLEGAGLLVVLSGSFTTLIFVWTVIDIVELLVMLSNVRQASLRQSAVLSFMLSISGTFMVVWATVRSQAFGTPLNMTNIIPEVGLLLILAVGLRLVCGAIAFALMAKSLACGEDWERSCACRRRHPVWWCWRGCRCRPIPDRWYGFMLAFAALAAVYGGAMWAAAKNELDGRPFLVIAVAGMAFACVIQGNPIASIAWGVGLILYGGLIFLASHHDLPVIIIAGLGVIGFSGLPFTPTANGWTGLIAAQVFCGGRVFHPGTCAGDVGVVASCYTFHRGGSGHRKLGQRSFTLPAWAD